jgi:hypothetical protein
VDFTFTTRFATGCVSSTEEVSFSAHGSYVPLLFTASVTSKILSSDFNTELNGPFRGFLARRSKRVFSAAVTRAFLFVEEELIRETTAGTAERLEIIFVEVNWDFVKRGSDLRTEGPKKRKKKSKSKSNEVEPSSAMHLHYRPVDQSEKFPHHSCLVNKIC